MKLINKSIKNKKITQWEWREEESGHVFQELTEYLEKRKVKNLQTFESASNKKLKIEDKPSKSNKEDGRSDDSSKFKVMI